MGKAFFVLCVSSFTLHNNIHSADREWMPTMHAWHPHSRGFNEELPSSRFFSPTYSDRLGVSWSIAQQNVTFSCLRSLVTRVAQSPADGATGRNYFFLRQSSAPQFWPRPSEDDPDARASPPPYQSDEATHQNPSPDSACDASSRNHHHSKPDPRILSLAKFRLSQPITRPENVRHEESFHR